MKITTTLILAAVLFLAVLVGCADTAKTAEQESTQQQNPAEIIETKETLADTEESTEPLLLESPVSDFKYEFILNKKYVLINQYIGESPNVVIPSQIEGCPVTSLRGFDIDGFIQGVFQDTDIETVVIPKSIMLIGNRAFKNCTALTSVTIERGSDLETISIEAFQNCSLLKDINLENAEKLKNIEAQAFYNCTSIEKIKLPSNLETMGREAFVNCSSLKSINIPIKLNLMNIDGFRFYHVPALEEIVFDEGRESIQGYVFFGITSTVNIIIPKSVTSINTPTFSSIGAMNLYFSGDCPQLLGETQFAGTVTIYYDPQTSGWDTTPLKDVHTLIPT